MRSPLGILALGAAAAAASFLLAYQLLPAPHPHHPQSPSPTSHQAAPHSHAASDSDLAWLASEFKLDPPAFDRIRVLHAEYRPRCEELCRRIDDHTRRLHAALLHSKELTPETRLLIEEGTRVRAECHIALARHLLEVAHCMPPEQGRRYLELMLPATGITAASHPIGDFTHARPHD